MKGYTDAQMDTEDFKKNDYSMEITSNSYDKSKC